MPFCVVFLSTIGLMQAFYCRGGKIFFSLPSFGPVSEANTRQVNTRKTKPVLTMYIYAVGSQRKMWPRKAARIGHFYTILGTTRRGGFNLCGEGEL